MSDDDLRDKLIGLLGENQVTTYTDTDGVRTLRLTRPDEQADALMPIVREALAQALNVVALELADCENDCAGLLAERADQWRERP